MKRVHRRWQRLAWVLVAPTVAIVIGLALTTRSPVPANAALPAALSATDQAVNN